jgi:6-methylsalicylate decarboxylase
MTARFECADGDTAATAGCLCCASRRGFLRSAAAGVAATLLDPLTAPAVAQDAAARPPHRIDVHHHILPPPYVAAARDRITATAPGFDHVFQWTPEKSIEAMDQAGIAVALTSISTPGIWFGNAEETRVLARQSNEYAAEMVRSRPGRFGLLAALPLPDVDGSLREIEYALDVLKADGFGLMTSYGDKWPGDRAFAPVFEELNRRKSVVFFHPTTPSCCTALIPEVPSSAMEFLFDTSRAIASLLYSGTFSRLTDIRFIFSHSGGTMPPIAERIARLAAVNKTVAARLPNGALHELEKLYYDVATSVGPTNLGALLKLVPLSHVLFGTDYPYLPVAATLSGLLKYGFSDQDLLAIERSNALTLFPRLAQAR